MNETELKYRFSVLFNNIMSNAAPGMNDYEISYYLTKGQLELVKDYLNPNGNKYKEGMDGSMKRQADFSALIQTANLSVSTDERVKFDSRSTLYVFPSSYLAILNDNLTLSDGEHTFYRQVIPLSFEEYTRLMSKPYKEPMKNQAWRLYSGTDVVELITTTGDAEYTKTYTVRYVRYPKPIIVSDLSLINRTLSIDGLSSPRTSELNEELHEEIVQRAVELAKASYATDQSGQAQLQNQLTVGQRSE